MINLEFKFADGTTVMIYDVHPRSQNEAIRLPDGAISVVIWLGAR